MYVDHLSKDITAQGSTNFVKLSNTVHEKFYKNQCKTTSSTKTEYEVPRGDL